MPQRKKGLGGFKKNLVIYSSLSFIIFLNKSFYNVLNRF